MSKRNLLLLALALLIAGFTGLAVRSRMQTPAPVVEQAKEIRILTATRDIGAGTFIRGGRDLAWKTLPNGTQPDLAQITDTGQTLESFDGAVARANLKSGDAVLATAILKPGAGGFLSAVLDPGMRAVTVNVDASTGNAGFIFPGDRVDLVVAHRASVTETPTSAPQDTIVSSTFIHNIRVVAVDQALNMPDSKAIVAKTITVEVSSKDAEKIAVAEQVGKVSLVLRSIANTPEIAVDIESHAEIPLPEQEQSGEDAPNMPTTEYTSDREISPALARNNDGSARIRVIRGTEMQTYEFFRGKE